MKRKSGTDSYTLGLLIVLLCLIVIPTVGSELTPNAEGGPRKTALPPLPPEYSGEAAPISESKSEYISLDLLRLGENQIQLYPGWNMISTPFWLQDGYNTASVVFAGVDTGGRSTYYYDALNQTWTRIYPATVIEPLKGIWIYSTESEQITLNFAASQPIPYRVLYTGWNLVGVWSFYPHSARDTLIAVSDVWTEAQGYDAINQVYEVSIINGGSGSHSDSRPMYPTKGYWVYVTAADLNIPLAGLKDNNDLLYPQVGVEWVNSYSVNPLSNSDDTALGFYNTLGNAYPQKWYQMFAHGDSEVQDANFKANDWRNIDGVDIALYAGHGELFGCLRLLESVTPMYVFYNACEWGDNDLEWIFLHACYTTRNPSNFKGIFHRAMNGLHLVCGYYSDGADTVDGVTLGNYLMGGVQVRNAWFATIDATTDPPRSLQVIGETSDCGEDHIWGQGSVISDPPVDEYYTTWFYYCT